MCGACGRAVATDAWSGVFSTSRARWEAARIVGDVLRDSGHPARVSCSVGVWVVHSGTGRSVLVDTASQMWQVLLSLPGPRLDMTVLGDQPPTPVLAALAASARAVTRSNPPQPKEV